jgi:hypothetical protein
MVCWQLWHLCVLVRKSLRFISKSYYLIFFFLLWLTEAISTIPRRLFHRKNILLWFRECVEENKPSGEEEKDFHRSNDEKKFFLFHESFNVLHCFNIQLIQLARKSIKVIIESRATWETQRLIYCWSFFTGLENSSITQAAWKIRSEKSWKYHNKVEMETPIPPHAEWFWLHLNG